MRGSNTNKHLKLVNMEDINDKTLSTQYNHDRRLQNSENVLLHAVCTEDSYDFYACILSYPVS